MQKVDGQDSSFGFETGFIGLWAFPVLAIRQVPNVLRDVERE
jgi:hypothetical protein